MGTRACWLKVQTSEPKTRHKPKAFYFNIKIKIKNQSERE